MTDYEARTLELRQEEQHHRKEESRLYLAEKIIAQGNSVSPDLRAAAQLLILKYFEKKLNP
jgi:hypothetical protein